MSVYMCIYLSQGKCGPDLSKCGPNLDLSLICFTSYNWIFVCKKFAHEQIKLNRGLLALENLVRALLCTQ